VVCINLKNLRSRQYILPEQRNTGDITVLDESAAIQLCSFSLEFFNIFDTENTRTALQDSNIGQKLLLCKWFSYVGKRYRNVHKLDISNNNDYVKPEIMP
jgi:hypothetical protein